MYKQEKKRTMHLILLICLGAMAAALCTEIILMKWEQWMVFQLLGELAVCFAVHVIGKVPQVVEKWLYFALAMHGFIYYGLHESSIYMTAPIIIALMTLYFVTGFYDLVNISALFYFGVMICSLVFVPKISFQFTAESITRLVVNSLLVLLAVYIAKLLRERRRSEQRETAQMIEKLEEENRRTEDFLTNVSHELRTPINAVTGLTAVMLKNENDSVKRENLLSVRKAGYRLFNQIEDILDYTEIDTGRMTAGEDSYMITSLVNDVITENKMNDVGAGLELIFDVEAKMPSVLIGDSKKVKRIITHLVENALKFTEEGGVYIRIYTTRKQYGVNLCIQVRDTGIGMDAESLSKITERFYQSSGGRERKVGGLGLGLPIVYGMVSAMEGFIHVESGVGTGTTVTVSIPQKVSDESAAMKISDPSGLCLGCYLIPEKYKIPQVKKFYNEMIANTARELDIPIHRVFAADEVETLVSTYRLTHLFIAAEEYESAADYLESLDDGIQVIVVASAGYLPRKNSRVKVLYKPFYALPVVNMLNSSVKSGEPIHNTRMLCPDVRVLVVDDEPMNRMVAEGILKDYNMDVHTAGSGAEAVEICQNEEFDLILMDHMMPEMDGIEALKQIRKLKSTSKDTFAAVAFTANAVSGAREMFLREGFDEFLSKPVETPELERVLRKVLPKSRIKYMDKPEEQPVQSAAQSAQPTAKPVQPVTQLAKPVTQSAKPVTQSAKSVTQSAKSVTQSVQPAAQSVKPVTQSLQPAAQPTQPLPAEFSRLASVGINIEGGLTYCRKDKDFYLLLLSKFAEDAEHKAKDIKRLYDSGDIDNYRIQVHALKSSSKMVGADELSDTAREMESAAKENDTAYISKNHDALMTLYDKTIRQIRSAVGIKEKDAETSPDAFKEISREEFIEKLKELRGLFDTYEADSAQKLIAELSGTSYRGIAVKRLLEGIKKDVNDFEYESAAAKVSSLAQRVEGVVQK